MHTVWEQIVIGSEMCRQGVPKHIRLKPPFTFTIFHAPPPPSQVSFQETK
jgi:hypothetical protein